MDQNLLVWAFAPSLIMLLLLSLPPCHSQAWAVLISSTYSRQWQCSTPRSPSPIPSRSIPPIPQKVLSGMIQAQHFHILLGLPPLPNRARLLSVAAPHASSWLLVVPSPGLGLHLESNEYQMAIRWWLGLDTFGRSMCSFCPDTALDPLGHHAVTCRHGGDRSYAIIFYRMRYSTSVVVPT